MTAYYVMLSRHSSADIFRKRSTIDRELIYLRDTHSGRYRLKSDNDRGKRDLGWVAILVDDHERQTGLIVLHRHDFPRRR